MQTNSKQIKLLDQLFNVGIHKVGTHFGGDFYVGGSKCRQFQKVGGFKMAVVQIGGSGNNVGSCNSIVGQLVVATNSSGVAKTLSGDMATSEIRQTL